jgi:hypothetical protein
MRWRGALCVIGLAGTTCGQAATVSTTTAPARLWVMNEWPQTVSFAVAGQPEVNVGPCEGTHLPYPSPAPHLVIRSGGRVLYDSSSPPDEGFGTVAVIMDGQADVQATQSGGGHPLLSSACADYQRQRRASASPGG